MQIPSRASMAILGTLIGTATAPASAGQTYYVDFANGSDANPGTSPERPWQHAPGSAQKRVRLAPGDRVLFRGGVRYRGSLQPSVAGTAEAPISFDGSSWGSSPAIFDGSTPLTDARRCASAAECFNNPNWKNLWRVPIPATARWTDWVFGNDRPLQPAQYPDVPLMSADDTGRYLTIPKAKTAQLKAGSISQALPANFSIGTPVLGLWVQPNLVAFSDNVTVSATGVTLSSTGWVGGGFTPYTDRDNKFTLINLPAMVIRPGTYAMSPRDGFAIIWPRLPSETNFSIGARVRGINLAGSRFGRFQGFVFTNYAGVAGDFMIGPAFNSTISSNNIVISNNIFKSFVNVANRTSVIRLPFSGATLEKNQFYFLPFTSAIQIDNTALPTIVRCNIIGEIGRTGIRFNNVANGSVIGNYMTRLKNIHGNGISMYGDTRNATITDNIIVDSDRPFTMGGSSSSYFSTGTKSMYIARNTFISSNSSSAGLISYGYAANPTIVDNYLSGPSKALDLRGTETGIVVTGNTMVGGVTVRNGAKIYDPALNISQDPDGNGALLNGTVDGYGPPAMCQS